MRHNDPRIEAARYTKRRYFDLFRSQGCARCGSKETDILELHHLDPSQKVANPSAMIFKAFSIIQFVEELKKCEVICPTCDRREHRPKINHRLNQEVEEAACHPDDALAGDPPDYR